MAKIVYEDGTEKDFNEEDYISKEEISENYLSKEEVETNYVSKEKYDQKKKQTKEAFKQLDLAKKEGAEVDKEAMANQIREEITFSTKHGFDVIPEEIKAVKTKYPDLSWEQAYKISDYQQETETVSVNPNPGREKTENTLEKKEYSYDEIADLAENNPTAYGVIASKVEKGEVKII